MWGSGKSFQKLQSSKWILKITVFKVDILETKSFHFFTFCSVYKIQKKICDVHHIAHTNVFVNIRRSIKLPKKVFRRFCGQNVHFGSIRWIRPKLRGQKGPSKYSKSRKLKFIAQYHWISAISQPPGAQIRLVPKCLPHG